MIFTEESVAVDCPADEVFDFFANPDSPALFMTNVIVYRLISGEAAEVGSIMHGVAEVAGLRLEVTEELVGAERGRYLHQRSTNGNYRYEVELRFDPDGGRTRVTWRQEAEVVHGLFDARPDSVVSKLYARDVRSNLRHAKSLLESESTPPNRTRTDLSIHE